MISPLYTKQSFRLLIVAVAALVLTLGAFAEDGGGRKVRSKVSPSYPELAKKMNIRGTVKIEVVVAPSGSVKSTRVIGGHPLLVGAAQDASKQWKYEPATEETTTVIEFNFTPGM